MILSEKAIEAMAREDAAAEAMAKRNGWMDERDCYGFVCISRNVVTGEVQNSRVYRTRAEALAYGHAKRVRNSPWVHEAIDRVRTVKARAAA